jgi:hypothetical protein
MTYDELENARTPAGGYSRQALARLGVPWPPPKGWRKRLLAGKPVVLPPTNYDGPEPGSPEFDSRLHGLLAPPKVTYRKLK